MKKTNIILTIVFIATVGLATYAFAQADMEAAKAIQPDMEAKIGVKGPGAMDYFVVGMKKDATDGHDNAYDTMSPGGSFNETYIQAYMDHPEWDQVKSEFRYDIRSIKAKDVWTVSVYTNLPVGKTLTLWLMNPADIPPGYTLTAQDMETGKTIAVKESGYKFKVTTSDAIRYFTVKAKYVAPKN